MKIKYIEEEILLGIKSNYEIVFKEIIQKKRTSLEEMFGNDNIIKESNIPADQFNLDMSKPADKAEATDLDNVIQIYSAMKHLTSTQASDERIWAAYAFSICQEYMGYRWAPSSPKDMMNRYLFSYSPKRSLFRNGIARLWWIGKLTYDPQNKSDPFRRTAFICKNQDYINNLLDINFSNNPNILHPVLDALIEAEKGNIPIDRNAVRDISRYVNMLGGTYILDCLTSEELKEKVTKRLTTLTYAQVGGDVQ